MAVNRCSGEGISDNVLVYAGKKGQRENGLLKGNPEADDRLIRVPGRKGTALCVQFNISSKKKRIEGGGIKAV